MIQTLYGVVGAYSLVFSVCQGVGLCEQSHFLERKEEISETGDPQYLNISNQIYLHGWIPQIPNQFLGAVFTELALYGIRLCSLTLKSEQNECSAASF